ncbi:hypothetical protein SAMN02745157_4852 [Kaistia soli DSM 19436]|uniref:DUF6651 domain-containing protein n=1 Tax=Kaistia soli DSM 19436 TaxID=1122133 RepID=A0A1M5MR03_9HYPH|nr:DUF6651 domain-containing protein [Kaistia soli]SHG79502.1 hypothetical protein SAMN02745157_4852 [Kaistia soli DSM 19436]
MKLKLDDAGHAVVSDGKPVYVTDDGKEIAFDAPATVATISRLNGEARGHREAKEAAEGKLKAFEGIEDGDAARKALETIRNLDQGQLVTAGKVQEIKDAAAKAAKDQVEAAAKASGERIKELEAANQQLTDGLYAEKVGGAFSRSKFISDKVAVPGDMIQAMFGTRFKIEDGKIVGHDAAGNKLYSRAKPGELAEFDEALEMLVDGYGYKDNILKGSGGNGGGSRGGVTGPAGGKTLRRDEFNKLSPADQMKTMQGGQTQIVD